MNPLHTILCGLVILAACRPASIVTVLPVSSGTTVKLIDSTALERPVFGSAGTVLKAPFGPVATVPRLQKVVRNGKDRTEYVYNDQGRLSEKIVYAGEFILSSSRYFYEGTTVNKVEYWLNGSSNGGTMMPTGNNLQLVNTAIFNATAKSTALGGGDVLMATAPISMG